MAGDDVNGIDLEAVLRRARRRRRPRAVAAIAGGVVAVAAIATPVVAISLPVTGIVASSGSAGSTASAPDLAAPSTGTGAGQGSDARSADSPAERLQRCGAQLATVPSATSDLVLSVTPLTAEASAAQIPVQVTLTNVGPTRITGSGAASAAIALSRGGVVIWHSNGAMPLIALPLVLDPGASTTIRATLQPVVCGPEDETRPAFREDLPAAGAGGYEVTAAFDVVPGGDPVHPILVTSAPAPLILR